MSAHQQARNASRRALAISMHLDGKTYEEICQATTYTAAGLHAVLVREGVAEKFKIDRRKVVPAPLPRRKVTYIPPKDAAPADVHCAPCQRRVNDAEALRCKYDCARKRIAAPVRPFGDSPQTPSRERISA